MVCVACGYWPIVDHSFGPLILTLIQSKPTVSRTSAPILPPQWHRTNLLKNSDPHSSLQLRLQSRNSSCIPCRVIKQYCRVYVRHPIAAACRLHFVHFASGFRINLNQKPEFLTRPVHLEQTKDRETKKNLIYSTYILTGMTTT